MVPEKKMGDIPTKDRTRYVGDICFSFYRVDMCEKAEAKVHHIFEKNALCRRYMLFFLSCRTV